jgi:probable rRNA maturation factor
MIEVNDLTRSKIGEGLFKKIANEVLDREKKKKNLSIVLVGQAKIKELNRKYRKKNRVTDVLAFPYGDFGEIVLCLPKIRDNARKYKSSSEREMTRVLIHGILHLLSYGHEEGGKEAERMRKKEEYYLSKIKL